jgi:ankyrin repeat protein
MSLRGRLDRFAELLAADPALVHRRFPELDCGSTGARRLLLQGATLLHVAAEFGSVEAARLLLDRGAEVDARATVDEAGVGGQTAIFHAVTQAGDWGLPVAQLLVERGADLSIRVKLPAHYARRWVMQCGFPVVRAEVLLCCESEELWSEPAKRRVLTLRRMRSSRRCCDRPKAYFTHRGGCRTGRRAGAG